MGFWKDNTTNYFKGKGTGKLDPSGNEILEDSPFMKELKSGEVLGSVFEKGAGLAGSINEMTMSADEQMDEKGNTTTNLTPGLDVAGGAKAGLDIGKRFGPVGAIIGTNGGGLAGGVKALVKRNNMPTASEMSDQKLAYQQSQNIGGISPEANFSKQQNMHSLSEAVINL